MICLIYRFVPFKDFRISTGKKCREGGEVEIVGMYVCENDKIPSSDKLKLT